MQLTTRDRKLIEDVALHHVMTREQIVRLGYFSSVSRANRRLLRLVKAGCLSRVVVTTSAEPRKAVYRASKGLHSVIDSRIVALLASRRTTAMQIDHSLAVVEVRIKLRALGVTTWMAEPQCRHQYVVSRGSARRTEDVRPDGLAKFGDKCFFVEVDRGNVSLPRIRAKFASYGEYIRSGAFGEAYGALQPAVLLVTTSARRKLSVTRQVPKHCPLPVFIHQASTFDAFSKTSEVAQ